MDVASSSYLTLYSVVIVGYIQRVVFSPDNVLFKGLNSVVEEVFGNSENVISHYITQVSIPKVIFKLLPISRDIIWANRVIILTLQLKGHILALLQ